MIHNRVFNTYPIFAHAPGRIQYIPLWSDMLAHDNRFQFRCQPLDCLEIVTFNNGSKGGYNNKPLGLFEKSLSKRGLAASVLGENVIPWKNCLKLPLLVNHLKLLDKPYVLIADSSDVILCKKIDDIIERFERFECDALFNGEKISWPVLPYHLSKFEPSLHPDCYLNAGLWLARTEFALELATAARDAWVPDNLAHSEQVHFKYVYPQFYPRMQVDSRCEIFQGMNRVTDDEINFLKMI